ncbi:uncharacterized protein LOC118438707 isoform X2 [Folsomia candida]|uniref:uncharacterized protein LOC118438707 isoform X2 n=1 Tax=Folsomia candida TaxID=158441 RepID=UPI0016055E99|nr:uncharacterized protein LOC118438707 isoform X2 [Folsomia candida]
MAQSPLQEIETRSPGLIVFPFASGKNYAATLNGFYYVHHSSGLQKHTMRCTRHHKGCHGKINLTPSYKSLISETMTGHKTHSHPAEPTYCERKYAAWKLRSTAKSSRDPTSAIVAQQLQSVPVEVQGSFPKLSSLQRVVQRSRAV